MMNKWKKIKCFYNIRVHVWDLGCYYQTTSCQPINYRQFVPQKQTVTNGVVGLCWRWCFPFKIKPLIYIFLLQKIKKKIIPDKQFHQVLKKVQTDLAMHLYWYCTDLGSARTSWRWLEFHDKHQWDFVFSLSYKN